MLAERMLQHGWYVHYFHITHLLSWAASSRPRTLQLSLRILIGSHVEMVYYVPGRARKRQSNSLMASGDVSLPGAAIWLLLGRNLPSDVPSMPHQLRPDTHLFHLEMTCNVILDAFRCDWTLLMLYSDAG